MVRRPPAGCPRTKIAAACALSRPAHSSPVRADAAFGLSRFLGFALVLAEETMARQCTTGRLGESARSLPSDIGRLLEGYLLSGSLLTISSATPQLLRCVISFSRKPTERSHHLMPRIALSFRPMLAENRTTSAHADLGNQRSEGHQIWALIASSRSRIIGWHPDRDGGRVIKLAVSKYRSFLDFA
jgi:hypothetical protein